MRVIVTTITLMTILMVIRPQQSAAQVFEDAGQYIEYISKANEKLTATYLSYTSALAHNKSARKQEKRRQDVVNAIINTRADIQGMPPWKGDRSFKDTTVAYLKILNSVFNEDYAKIVNMEEIAEQSYDAMEAYLLAQEKADEKLEEARLRQHQTTKRFAAKNNVTLLEGESETGKKSRIASELNGHYNDVYLVFFKPYKQEMYLMDAIEKGNLIAIEQNINSLEKFANEGLEKLKNIQGYNNDQALVNAATEAMNFYITSAQRSKGMTDFFLKKESFEKIKKAMDNKRANERTQKDIDQYNAAVDQMNAASNEYNSINQQLNKERTNMLNNWNKKVSRYMDEYMPVQKKQT
jgi:hypothetical protein